MLTPFISLPHHINTHLPSPISSLRMVLGRLMATLKTKLRCLKVKKSVLDEGDSSRSSYDKIEKSESMRMEIRSKKARKLIEETLRVADSPRTTKTYSF
ncbi:hypothetical protein L1987_18015 [Smallanthus sonchifolius]|uniref:Uncharacterized protein n=1 Tax=Smallanthus sonchifolius TaxID=185202 RepID=A0ACB9J0J7_9ASTR|nr:hypothetical protein L1987_18015 [Smallanthus sonchifolius]